jgi:NADH:ubiquinone oxidoreductase subunit C
MEEFFNNIKESFKEATLEFETINIKIDSTEWINVHKKLRDEFNLKFFSWLSAIDWDNEVSVGEAPKESVSPSFEIITCLSDLDNTNLVTLSTSISKSEPNINSLIDVYAGANWHEREAYEMFGINFENHPNLEKLYLPDGY